MRLSLVLGLTLSVLPPCFAGEGGAAPTVTIPDPKPVQQILGKDVRGWVEHLKKYENEKERKLAMFCLIDFGPAAVEAVPELLLLCKDELQPDTQRWAMNALGAIGAAAKDAAPDLVAVLNDVRKPAAHRAAACEALAQIDPEAQPVRKAILAAIRDPQADVRAAAMDAAVTLHPYDPAAGAALAKALGNPADALAAATALRCVGAPALETLAKACERGETATRVAAAEALSRMGPAAASALPAILKTLKRERDAKSRAALVLAAVRMAPRDPAVLDALVDRMVSGEDGKASLMGEPKEDAPRPQPCEMETRLLTAAGPAAVPALRHALRARETDVRRLAVNIMAKLRQPTDDVVDDLLARTQDKEKDVRLAAVQALDALGPAAAKTRDALLELARQDSALQRPAELAAANVARDPHKPRFRSLFETRPEAELLAALKDQHPVIRQEAAEALRTRPENASAVAGALLDVLSDKEWQVRAAAGRSLAHFGKYARVALSTFVEWLENSSRAAEARVPDEPLPPDKKDILALPRAALAALAGMGEGAKPALPALVRLAASPLPDTDTEIRALLGAVLRIIGPDAVPGFTAELKNPVAEKRARAARALASMGPVAATAVPDLIELSKSAVDSDAQAGFAGLQAIGPIAYELAAPHLVKILREDLFADRRKWAAWALGDIRVPADGDRHKVIDALLLSLLDPDEAVCRAAHGALARVGAPALPRLREMLKLGEGEAPYWAVRVLARMKADPADVIPRLAELTLPGKRPVERGTAADLLGEYAPDQPAIIPPLLRLLGDREDYVARAAVRSLTPFGAQVLDPLGNLLNQRNPLVRRRALEALEAIRAALEEKERAL